MTKEEIATERRKQRRLAQLGSNDPVCLTCGHAKWTGFQFHHVAGQHYQEFAWHFCSTCHDDFSEQQRRLPPPANKKAPSVLYIAGRFLVGLADILAGIASAIETGKVPSASDARHANRKKVSPGNALYMTELARFLGEIAPTTRDLGLRLLVEDGKQSEPELQNEN